MHEGQADFGMPMAYWNWRDDEDAAVAFLEETWRQWREITDKRLSPSEGLHWRWRHTAT